MPLVKQRGFKFSILCDVFLLMFLISLSILISVVSSSVPTTETFKFTTTLGSQLNYDNNINKNNNSSINEVNNNNKTIINDDDDDNNNNKTNIKNNKELPIQYAELETLKTLSKRFDIYSDFSKIPFDTIHRILRDEEPEYRNDDQRIQRRWKKSTSTEGSVHQQQQQQTQQMKLGKLHVIEKRSPTITIPTTITNEENINYELSFLNSNYNNNNDNNNNNKSSDNSTKIINLENKNYSIETINKILLNQIKNSNKIEHLNLNSNNISDFSMLFINKLVNLKYLDLSNNKLKYFQLNENTSNIKVLNLSKNQIVNFTLSLPTTSSYNSNLNELNLSKNNLKSVKYINVSLLNGLEIFDLSCNQIQYIDKNYFSGQMKTLKRLNLSGNKLDSILKEPFYNLLNIDTLILSNNNISIIDLDTFLVLPNLQYLDLSYNNIQGNSIRALQGIPDLVGLSIAYNPKLGDSLQEFVASWSLKELDISGTGLCQIPAALAQSVRSLKLVNNWFEIIRCGDLDSYPLLQYLDLSYSHIDDIEDDALGRLEILETLFLDHNNLNRVPISLPISLENLFLQNNQIMDIQPQTFQALINLKVLDLSENKIMYLPGLPLPKLLTLNLHSCELRGLSQSVVKTSPKLRDLLLDGNPIKCTDLLGIAEWASPCQSERISEPKEIKRFFINMQNYFQHFQGNNNGNSCEDNCCGNWKIKELKKPICANSNKTQKRLNQMNKIESQLRKYNSDADGNDDVEDEEHSSKRTLNLVRKGISNTKKFNEKNEKQQKLDMVQGNREMVGNEKGKVYDNQSGSLFMSNANSDKDVFKSSSLSLNSKNAAMPNEHETNMKNLKMLFNGTSTNEKLYKDINNNNSRSNNNKSNSFDAKIPILSLSFTSNESFVGDVSHETTTTVVGEKASKNIEKENEEKRQQDIRGPEKRIISNIKSDNNYVETSVLFESIRSQKNKQNELQFESKAEQQENIKNLEIPKIIEGKKPSKIIEMLPRKKQNYTSSTILNENFQERTMTLQNFSDTNLRTIDDGYIGKSVAIKSSQVNRNESSVATQQPYSYTQNKESVLALLLDNEKIPINDEVNSEFKSTIHLVAAPSYYNITNEKLANNKRIQTTKNTNNQRKVNFPETESNSQQNNSQNYKRKTIKDNINTELSSSTSPSTQDVTMTSSPMPITTKTLTEIIKINTIENTTTIPIATTHTTTVPSKLNKADKVVFFDQPLVIKENDIVNRNQNISHSLGRSNHQIETVEQETISTNNNQQNSQKQMQKQLQKNQQQQKDKRLNRNKKQRQQDMRPQFKGLKQKLPNLETISNDTRISSFNRYNLSASQQEKLDTQTTKTHTSTIVPTVINNIQDTLDKQHSSVDMKKDNEAVTTSNKSLSHGTINSDNSTNKSTHNATFLPSLSSLPPLLDDNDNIKMTQIILNVTKTNSTNLKRSKGKQQAKYNTKNQKVKAINLENSPLMKNENENYNNEEDFLAKNNLKNLKTFGRQTDSVMKTIASGSKYLSHNHHHLNTPKDIITTNSDIIGEHITTKNAKNHFNIKTDDIYDTGKLTTHSLMHHTINTAILPYTVDDYAFERSGNKEIHKSTPSQKDLLPIKLKNLQATNFDILSSYLNDEPYHQELESNFDSDSKTEATSISSIQQNHISFDSETLNSQNVIFKTKENVSMHTSSSNSLVNQTMKMNENFNITAARVTTENNNNNNSKSTKSYISNNMNPSNIGGSGSENGLPPEHWLDIRKATGHPGLFIVIGVTFGMLLTLGLIHIYRCRKPWYYYYGSQKGPHPLHHHHHHTIPHHHHHHLHDNSHRHHNNNTDEYNNRRHSLTNTFDEYCHCDEEDYYIEADHESQSSIRGDFLPMELLSLNTNTNENGYNSSSNNNNNNDNDGGGNFNRTRRNNNGHNLDIW